MKRAKRYNEGGMSLEQMYPEAKITRVPPNEPPGKSEKFKEIEADYKKSTPQTPGTRVTEPKFTDSGDTQDLKKVGRGRISGGGGGAAPIPKSGRIEMLRFKSGGKVSSASKRADGCCIKGKTKGKMV
jgi:hypothetical protein